MIIRARKASKPAPTSRCFVCSNKLASSARGKITRSLKRQTMEPPLRIRCVHVRIRRPTLLSTLFQNNHHGRPSRYSMDPLRCRPPPSSRFRVRKERTSGRTTRPFFGVVKHHGGAWRLLVPVVEDRQTVIDRHPRLICLFFGGGPEHERILANDDFPSLGSSFFGIAK